MRLMIRCLTLVAILIPGLSQADVMVFAAASMKGSLDVVAANWTQESGVPVVISYGGTPAMAKQIIEGAPAQVFISANEDWMDQLDQAGLLVPESRADLVSNQLVVVAAAGQQGIGLMDLPSALAGQKLAMGLVDAVPAGIYGKAALQKLGLWDTVAPSVVQAENVRSAMALVAAGEAAYGVVYATDAIAEPKVAVVVTIPRYAAPPIRYPAALIAPATAESTAFLDYLMGDVARAVFVDAGFLTAAH